MIEAELEAALSRPRYGRRPGMLSMPMARVVSPATGTVTDRARCWGPSRRRHTAQEQPFDVLIQYPPHPRAGERVVVVRRLHHGSSAHFVIEQP